MLSPEHLSTYPSKNYVPQNCRDGYHPSFLIASAGTFSLSAHFSSKAGEIIHWQFAGKKNPQHFKFHSISSIN